MVLAHADAKVGFGPWLKRHVPAYVESIESSFQWAGCVKAASAREAARSGMRARNKRRRFCPQCQLPRPATEDNQRTRVMSSQLARTSGAVGTCVDGWQSPLHTARASHAAEHPNREGNGENDDESTCNGLYQCPWK